MVPWVTMLSVSCSCSQMEAGTEGEGDPRWHVQLHVWYLHSESWNSWTGWPRSDFLSKGPPYLATLDFIQSRQWKGSQISYLEAGFPLSENSLSCVLFLTSSQKSCSLTSAAFCWSTWVKGPAQLQAEGIGTGVWIPGGVVYWEAKFGD